jgi:hypothetical protein
MTDRSQVQQAIDAGGGVLRLEPCWVPRSFMIPGRRLRLHPDDYYACGGHRGGINERWFSSTTNADNGPQVNSDVFAMFQSEVEGRIIPWDLLTKDVPQDKSRDLDYIINMLDWDANVNPRFGESNRRFPKPVKPFAETEGEGYREQWITYGTGWYSAKELTVLPRRSVTITDGAAYGIILTQGYGSLGKLSVSTPAMIRFGQMTEDELFVTAEAAKAGVRIENRSDTEPLVMLKHFGPGNPDAESFRKR